MMDNPSEPLINEQGDVFFDVEIDDDPSYAPVNLFGPLKTALSYEAKVC